MNTTLLPISIGILSWKSSKNLINTLDSYRRYGLLNISDDIKIFFQEISPEDEKLANQYQIPHIGNANNIGIGQAIIELLKQTKYKHFLFLEHDWELIEPISLVRERLSEGLMLLNQGYDIVRYRSRRFPGYPLYSKVHKGQELTYYDEWHKVTSPHLLDSLHWLDPAENFPDKIQKQGAFFVTTARWANWTNNPFLINKDFYLKHITPFAGDTIQLEEKIAPWWVQQSFRIAQGEGLFMHHDLIKYPMKSRWQKLCLYLKKRQSL